MLSSQLSHEHSQLTLDSIISVDWHNPRIPSMADQLRHSWRLGGIRSLARNSAQYDRAGNERRATRERDALGFNYGTRDSRSVPMLSWSCPEQWRSRTSRKLDVLNIVIAVTAVLVCCLVAGRLCCGL